MARYLFLYYFSWFKMYVRTKKLNCCYAYFTWPSQENCVLHSSDLVPFFKFEPEPIKLNLTLCGRLLRWLVVSVQGRAWRELAGMPWGCRGDATGVPRGCHPVGIEAVAGQPHGRGPCCSLLSATASEREMYFPAASLAVSATAFLLAWFFFPSCIFHLLLFGGG